MRTSILNILIFAGFGLSQTLSAQTAVVHCGHYVDVISGQMRGEHSILIDGDKIMAVEPGKIEKEGADFHDLSGHTCLPGLIDMHTHLTGETSPKAYEEGFRLNPADYALRGTAYAKRTLMAGFTSVRNLGDGGNASIALRNAINEGYVIGPRIFTAGKSIATTGGHADPTNGRNWELTGDPGPKEGVVNSASDARKAVRQRYKEGADLIKITATGGVLSYAKNGQNPQYTIEEIQAVVATARDYGFKVAAHAHGKDGIKRAVLGGVDSIEHGTFMSDEEIGLMKKHGTYYVPTITAGVFVGEKAKEPGYYPEIVRPKALAVGPQIQKTFTRAYNAGVKIAFGTDAGVYPHGENAREFVLMVEAGMPPIATIQAATKNAADLLGQNETLGSLEPGKYADVVAVPGDPAQDIKLMQHVDFVMKGGKVIKDAQQPRTNGNLPSSSGSRTQQDEANPNLTESTKPKPSEGSTPALGSKITSDADQKPQKYVMCYNQIDYDARYTVAWYDYWVEDMEAGPTGLESSENTIIHFSDRLPEAKECLRTLRNLAEQRSSFAKLDQAALNYVNAATVMGEIVETLHPYYDRKNYKDDDFAKGKKMHAPLVKAMKAFERTSDAFSRALNSENDKLVNADLLRFDSQAKRAFPYAHATLMLNAQMLARTAASGGPLAKLEKSLAEYEESLDKTIALSKSDAIQDWWSVGSAAEDFLKAAKGYLRASRNGLTDDKALSGLMNGHNGYNNLIRESNGNKISRIYLTGIYDPYIAD